MGRIQGFRLDQIAARVSTYESIYLGRPEGELKYSYAFNYDSTSFPMIGNPWLFQCSDTYEKSLFPMPSGEGFFLTWMESL